MKPLDSAWHFYPHVFLHLRSYPNKTTKRKTSWLENKNFWMSIATSLCLVRYVISMNPNKSKTNTPKMDCTYMNIGYDWLFCEKKIPYKVSCNTQPTAIEFSFWIRLKIHKKYCLCVNCSDQTFLHSIIILKYGQMRSLTGIVIVLISRGFLHLLSIGNKTQILLVILQTYLLHSMYMYNKYENASSVNRILCRLFIVFDLDRVLVDDILWSRAQFK